MNMPRTKRIITMENITELKQSDLEKIKMICYKKANRYHKVDYNDRNFELFYYDKYGRKKIYALCMHWNKGNGVGINFAIECTGDLLKASDWQYCNWEEANYPQMNGLISELNSPYNYLEIKRIYVKEDCSELKVRGR
jgi:hypothetical protein